LTIFAEIRANAQRVSERARSVSIDREQVKRLASELGPTLGAGFGADPAHQQLSDPDETLAYVVTLDALNFGSGWFPLLAKPPGQSGYYAIANALQAQFERVGSWSADALRRIEARELAQIFGQAECDRAPELDELLALFEQSLRELGRFLDTRCGGGFRGLVDRAGGSAATLVELLAEMPLYRDVSLYDGIPVPLYKRAQITAMDLCEAFDGASFGAFSDIDDLTIFADNLVPHVLRCEGALRYSAALAQAVDEGRLLAAGSPEEVEIRAVALFGVELVVAELRDRGTRTCARQLDQLLWHRGQSAAMKARPRHRCRCAFY
jgi:hypothetical protein